MASPRDLIVYRVSCALCESHKNDFPYAEAACKNSGFYALMTRRIPSTTPTKKPGRHAARTADFIFRGLIAVLVMLIAALLEHADGQEIPRPSYARQVERAALPTISNFKIGEVLLRVDAHLTTSFVDNVDNTPTGKADVIVSPEVGISAAWALTKQNTLQFRAGIGYAYYMNNRNLNQQTMTIAPDTALNFNVYAGDVKINFHDQMSMQQETISQGTLSGIASLNRFTNTAGISVLWDTNDVVWNLGYDHYNFITLGGANSSSGSTAASISNLDHSTDQLSASAAVKMNSVLIGGIEGVVSSSDYPKDTASNFTSVSAGPYFEWQVTRYTHAFLSGGYKGFFSGANAPGSVSVSSTSAAQVAQGDPSGFYANFSLVHRLNRYYSDRLEIGHSDEVEALSGHVQTNFVRYSGNWRVNQKVSLGDALFFEDVHIISGSALGGTVASDYWRLGGSLSTGYQISQHVDATLSYQYLKKEARRSSESYTQNRVTISLGYRF